MKKHLLFLIISLVTFNACNKDNNPVNSENLNAPSLISPLNNSSDAPISLTLSWSGMTGVTGYSLQVATDSSFSNISIIADNIHALNYQITGLNKATAYYWKVNATADTGKSEWSETWKFTTGDKLTTILLSPINNSNNIYLPTTFYWKSVPGATSYTLQVAINSTFTLFLYDQGNIEDTSYQVSLLKPLTHYFWRVSVNNNSGSFDWSTPNFEFTTASGSNTGTPCAGIPTVTYSGKLYHTVQIGDQCWLKENLNAGTMISGNNIQTNNNIIEKFCYQDNILNCDIYGGLYQWDEAMEYNPRGNNVQGICPSGWHIPTNIEFNSLATTVNNNGNSLKAISQGTGAGAGTDSSGFSIILSGYHAIQSGYADLGSYTNFWTSIDSDTTNAIVMWLWGGDSKINMNPSHGSKDGFSLRCIKN
jgi:uncharacterized protein (TIGR02145 family)